MSPLSINHPDGVMDIRNRVLVSAHVPGFAKDNKPGEQYIDYHRRYAREGVGLQITGGTPVHRSGMLSLTSDALWNLDDSIIPGYQRLSAAVHDEGGRILAQLAHSGGTVGIDQPRQAIWSASSIKSAIHGRVAHSMSVAEIQEIINAYASAAGRVKEGGLDGVEILSAFGFLPQAFLSPLTNQRHDEYGGSLSNRMRLLVDILSAVRAELGSNQILGVRLPGDEFEAGGLTAETMKSVCKHLDERGLVDYFNITAHTNFTHTGRSLHWAPTPTEHGVFVGLAAGIKQVVSLPVFTVGRVVDPAHANRIVESGSADMVGMTRAHLCDPEIVSKIEKQQYESIRPCVGANTCIANRYIGKPVRCMHNPELKSPGKRLVGAETSKNIAVIGAGPAGMEAARLCAERGHRVALFEAANQLGGRLATWSRSSSMTELGRIVKWREGELQRLKVAVHLGSTLTATEITELGVDDLIVATGSIETTRALFESSQTPVVTPTTLMQQTDFSGSKAVVLNDGRGQAGLVAAEWLLERGVIVEIITEDVAVANDLDPTNRDAWYRRLGQAGAVLTAQLKPISFDDGVLKLENVYSEVVSEKSGVDYVVDWWGCQPIDELVVKLSAHTDLNVHAIGDCLAPRTVELAMADALTLAEAI